MKVLIFDNDKWSQNSLIKLFRDYFPDIQILLSGNNTQETKALIQKYKPEVVIVNIEDDYFDFYDFTEDINTTFPYYIITSSRPEFIQNHNSFEIVGHLLKPIVLKNLTIVINIAKRRINQDNLYKETKNYMRLDRKFLGFLEMGTIQVVNINDIVYLKSGKEQTHFYLLDGTLKTSQKRVGEYEKILSKTIFFRIHRQYLVNMSFVSRVKTQGQTTVSLHKLNADLPVSFRKKNSLLCFLKIK